MIKDILNSNKGFSIVQVLVAAGMMGGLALVMTKLSENQMKVQNKTTENSEITEVYNRLQRTLLDSEACTNSLKNTQIAKNQNNVDISVIRTRHKINPNNPSSNPTDFLPLLGTSQIGGANKISNNLIVKSMKLSRGSTDEVTLRVNFEKISKNKSIGAVELAKEIKLDAKFDANNRITKCFSQMDAAVLTARREACLDLGAQWDSSTNQCNLTAQFISSALQTLNPIPVYNNGGMLTTQKPSNYQQDCRLSNKRCSRTNVQDCVHSCRDGFTRGGRASGRYNVSQSLMDKACHRKYWCIAGNGIGVLIPPLP